LVRVVAKRVDRLEAFEVDDPQPLTGAHYPGPRFAGQNDLVEQRAHAGTTWRQ
jgi:hypothetical protein